ncbi:aldehyde dehydrogenase (NADP(+)) [Rhodococcus sp. ACS1]|nr:aldehyde dehydrogenase (NADP(+)) [Rhodococcus sp. ACS1]
MRGAGTDMDLDTVLDQATAANAEFARHTPQQRYTQLVEIADRLDAAADELVPVAMEETHLPEPRLRGELARTTMQLRMFAEQARTGEFLDARIDDPDPDFGSGPRPNLRRMRVPIGVVLNFAASNFPFAFSVAGGDTASALAAGCPVIVKAHEGHPKLSELTARLASAALTDTGAPAGAFHLIEGRDAGVDALRDDRVDAATFTGSVRGGLFLAGIAAERPRPIPFYGELGSINPVFVSQAAIDARGQAIAEGFVDSFTLGSGQFCTKPGIVFLPTGHGLEGVLTERIGGKRTGALLTDSITSGFADRLKEIGDQIGGRMLVEPTTVDGCHQPALLAIDYPTFVEHSDNVLTEAFGPFSIIVEYTDVKQLTDAADRLHGSLTITLHAEEADADALDDLRRLAETRTGRLILNEWPTGVSVTPAQHHGGPFPSTTSPLHTAVGTAAVERFLRPVAFQNYFDSWLPEPLQEANPWNIPQKRSPAGQSKLWGRS